MNVYSVDILLCATVYVKAESDEEARRLARQSFPIGSDVEAPEEGIFCGLPLDDPRLPQTSLSPMMTITDTFPDQAPELLEEDVDAVLHRPTEVTPFAGVSSADYPREIAVPTLTKQES